MVTVEFTAQLQRFTTTPQVQCVAATLREALEAAFAVNPALRSYVLDDQARIRTHVAIFIDSMLVRNRATLAHALRADSRVYVLQALSGG